LTAVLATRTDKSTIAGCCATGVEGLLATAHVDPSQITELSGAQNGPKPL
jgi:hypothetical protein